jgi:hypothetical protein
MVYLCLLLLYPLELKAHGFQTHIVCECFMTKCELQAQLVDTWTWILASYKMNRLVLKNCVVM